MVASKRILVVDDEEHARRGLGLLLNQAGFEVETAADASQALDCLQHKHFNMVLSDLKMPGMSGLTFLRELHQRYPETGVILMTAHAGVDSYLEAIHLGAYDYINKPLCFDDLMAIMQRYFTTH
jgi:DNA-binding NtrC family response regulator